MNYASLLRYWTEVDVFETDPSESGLMSMQQTVALGLALYIDQGKLRGVFAIFHKYAQ